MSQVEVGLLTHILHQLKTLNGTLTTMSGSQNQALQALQQQVASSDQVMQSAVTLIQGLADQIKAAGTDPAALQALTTALQQNADALASAVAANGGAPVTNPGTVANSGTVASGTTITPGASS